MGGIKSEFLFESYKLDSFNFSIEPRVKLLFRQRIEEQEATISYGIRKPTFIESENRYIGGVTVTLQLAEDGHQGSRIDLMKLEAGMTGVFKITEGSELSEKQIQNLVKIQIPSILMPYLRAAVSNFLCAGGWMHSPLPLVNVIKLVENVDFEIDTIPGSQRSGDIAP